MNYVKSKRLADADAIALILKWQSGGDDKARNQVLTAHVPLVAFMVRKYFGWFDDAEGDLFQEGMIGLAYAIDKFKDVGNVFSTYARYWIYSRMSRHVCFNGGHGYRHRKVYARREELNGRLANGEPYYSVAKSVNMKVGGLKAALAACEPMARLDAENGAMLNTLPANDVTDEELLHQEKLEVMARAIDELPPQLKRVMKFRLRGWKQERIAKRFKTTHQTISAIEQRAISVIRAKVEKEERKAS